MHFVEALFGAGTFQFVIDLPCTKTKPCAQTCSRFLPHAHDPPRAYYPPNDVYKMVHEHVRNLISRPPTVMEPSVRYAVQRPSAGRYLILIVRRQGGRRFFPGAETRLGQRLHKLTGLATRLYWGNESVAATLRLFAGGAAAVVGYHGAGLANVVFSPQPLCVIELSTYMHEPEAVDRCASGPAAKSKTSESTASSSHSRQLSPLTRPASLPTSGHGSWWPLPPPTPRELYRDVYQWGSNSSLPSASFIQRWRSNREAVQPWNPLIRWTTYHISLSQMLDGNGWPCARHLPPGLPYHMVKQHALAPPHPVLS